MNRSNWLMLALFAAVSVLLRVWQNLTGFEADTGLAVRGNLPGLLLPFVLVLAAAYFIAVARKMPAKDAVQPELTDCFRFDGMTALLCAVAGAFLVIAGGLVLVREEASLLYLLLALFAAASAISVLGTVGVLRGGKPASGVLLLVPVCCLIVCVIVLYRADTSDPVLARVYVEILAVTALTFAAVQRAAFAARDGAPRVWLPACAMSAILALTAAAEGKNLATILLFAGSALIELGFLRAAQFHEKAA